jgi:hypothetical protein
MLIILLIGLVLLILPAAYELRMQSGIFQLDYYLWWIIGVVAGIFFFWTGYSISRIFLVTVSPFFLFLTISTFYWREDSNSVSFFISCLTGLGIFLFLLQIQLKIQFLIWAVVFSVLVQLTVAVKQLVLSGNTITGQFFNSGHWGNFLSIQFPILILLLQRHWMQQLLRMLLMVLLFATAGFLFLSMARAAIVGVATAIVFLFARKVIFGIRWWMIIAGIVLSGYAIWLVLFTKSASLLGRITVYQVGVEIWKENWLFGIGPNRFAAVYNHYQADFLQRTKLPIERELLATNMLEAFNWQLQILVEYGTIGAALLILMMVNWWRMISKREPVIIASFIVVLTAGLFSNPFHITPVSFLLIVLLAAASCPAVVIKRSTIGIGKLFVTLQVLLLIPYIGTQILSEYYWKRASVQALYDGFSMAQPSYKKAARWLSGRGSFLFNYGAEACIAGDTELAITQLEAAAQRLASNQLYVYLGDAYLKSGKMREAEQSYLLAIAMVPATIYPKYRLIHFYLQQANYSEACKWTKKVVEYPVKIPTPEAFQLVREIRQLTAPYMHYCSG